MFDQILVYFLPLLKSVRIQALGKISNLNLPGSELLSVCDSALCIHGAKLFPNRLMQRKIRVLKWIASVHMLTR